MPWGTEEEENVGKILIKQKEGKSEMQREIDTDLPFCEKGEKRQGKQKLNAWRGKWNETILDWVRSRVAENTRSIRKDLLQLQFLSLCLCWHTWVNEGDGRKSKKEEAEVIIKQKEKLTTNL